MTRLRLRSRLVAILALSLLAFLPVAAAPAATADAYYPLFEVSGDAHELGSVNDLVFNLEYLSSAGQAARVTIQTPAGFSGSLVQAVGTKLGAAGVGLLPAGTNISTDSGAKITAYTGSIVVMDPATYAADVGAQACAPGSHTAVWGLTLANVAHGNMTLPVAVDASHGRYKLTICFDAFETSGKQVEYLYLSPESIFRNPTKHGFYLFDGVVTPYGTDKTPNSVQAYELRAYQDLPQLLSATATYDTGTKTLTVSGSSSANGRARKDIYVHVYGATTSDAVNWTELGETTTEANGSYTFTRRFATNRYPYVYAGVHDYNGPTCPGASRLPAGCASTSTDGRDSSIVKVLAG